MCCRAISSISTMPRRSRSRSTSWRAARSPPALPMIKIGTDHFWDGGIVSNTPLQHLLDQEDKLNTLIFQIDLFSARGVLPRDLQDVLARQKDIMYSSRPRYNTDVYRRIQTWKKRLHLALDKIPEERLSDE